MTSLVFFGSSGFSVECLKCLLEMKDLKVKKVMTLPNRRGSRGLKETPQPVRIFCEQRNLPLALPEEVSSPSFIEQLREEKYDMAVVCSYGKIFKQEFFKSFPLGAFNFHPSLLPKRRGAAPVERTLLAGEVKSGVCLQMMEMELDAGDLVGVKTFPIDKEDSAKEVYLKVYEATRHLIKKDFMEFLRGEKKLQKQQGEVTYAPKIQKKEAEIIWSQSNEKIHNQIRALVLGPQAFTYIRNERIKITGAQILEGHFNKPGEVISSSKELVVACGKGALKLLDLQRESRKKQKAEEFLKGFPLAPGERFEKGKICS